MNVHIIVINGLCSLHCRITSLYTCLFKCFLPMNRHHSKSLEKISCKYGFFQYYQPLSHNFFHTLTWNYRNPGHEYQVKFYTFSLKKQLDNKYKAYCSLKKARVKHQYGLGFWRTYFLSIFCSHSILQSLNWEFKIKIWIV